MTKLPVWSVSRLRMETDGQGVTTLVTSEGCPLRCKYCINPQSWNGTVKPVPMSPLELYDAVKTDDLYFRATNGGVTFGGGEPLLYAEFLPEFRKLCGNAWRLLAETSLNLPPAKIETACGVLDGFIVDIKDMDPSVYHRYTGHDNQQVIDNLEYLIQHYDPEQVLLRLPLIEGYNTQSDIDGSERILRGMGFRRFDFFRYRLPKA